MHQSKFTETQIVSTRKRPMPVVRSMRSGGITASARPPTTSGKPSSGASTRRM